MTGWRWWKVEEWWWREWKWEREGMSDDPGKYINHSFKATNRCLEMYSQQMKVWFFLYYIYFSSPLEKDADKGNPLQGASRTTGGVFRGKALGNELSHADTPEVFGGHEVKPVKGDIRVFTSLADPTNLKLEWFEPLSTLEVELAL